MNFFAYTRGKISKGTSESNNFNLAAFPSCIQTKNSHTPHTRTPITILSSVNLSASRVSLDARSCASFHNFDIATLCERTPAGYSIASGRRDQRLERATRRRRAGADVLEIGGGGTEGRSTRAVGVPA